MFYTGFNGSRFQIGQASSYDGITWLKHTNNPIITRLSLDNKDSHDPSVLMTGNNYEMWYVSSDGGGGSNFRIQRAVKTADSSWTNDPIQPVLAPIGTWDTDGLSSPFVIKNGTMYKMWYSGFLNGLWRIGYATSPDGITWTPYAGNPIIDMSPNSADGASVIYNGSGYELYFHGINGDLSYTTSADGVTGWSTPVTILSKGASYDANYMAGPSALRLMNGTTFLYYGGSGNGTWQINLAADGPLPTPFPTPTPTPIELPTTTPTLTPTPTSTPTPVPIGAKKVIVVPGFGGSWNKDALLNCKSDGYTGSWTNWTIANADVYQPLLTGLTTAGYQALPFWYDWRKRIPDTAPKLASFIQANRYADETVDLIGHSMGGLVGRTYLESATTTSHVDKLLTVGTPHQGSVFTYPLWSGGEMWVDDDNVRLGYTMMRIGCLLAHKPVGRSMVTTILPSVQNLLPTFDYLKDNKTHIVKAVTGMNAQNNLLPTAFAAPFYGVTVGAISGSGTDTLKQLEVTTPNRVDTRLGNWADGKPTKNKTYADGDGTVLTESSQLPGAKNITLPLNHVGLVTSPTGIKAITDFLSDTLPLSSPQLLNKSMQTQTIKPSARASVLLIVIDGATATLTDKHGHKYTDTDGQITILNPPDEEYRLTVKPVWFHTYRVVVVQLFEDGTTRWKEYNRRDFWKKHFRLHFDRSEKHEDILKDD